MQDWAKKKIKARNSNKEVSLDPLMHFITAEAGVGINSGLSIPSYVNGYTLPRLLDSERGRLRNLYSEVLVVLIDDILMFFNICLLIYIKGYVKYLAVQKVNHLQLYLFLW